MNIANIREVVDRILALVRSKTTKLNPTADDIGLRSMFDQVCAEYPDIPADAIKAAFFSAQDELNKQFHRQQAATATQGTVH